MAVPIPITVPLDTEHLKVGPITLDHHALRIAIADALIEAAFTLAEPKLPKNPDTRS